MVGTVQQGGIDTYNRISCQRSLLAGFCNSLFNSREIVLRYSTAEYLLLKAIGLVVIKAWREFHYNISVLSVSTGLLLIFTLNLYSLLNSLTISKTWLFQVNGNIVSIL